MKIHLEQIIQKDSFFNREYLRGLADCPKLDANSSIVYIYSLVDEVISYPNCSGHTLYIGESEKSTKATGARFVVHISQCKETGATGGLNHCLSRYYWRGIKIKLRIFVMDEAENKKSIEMKLLQIHVKQFGALPICQGVTSCSYHTTKLHNLVVPDELNILKI